METHIILFVGIVFFLALYFLYRIILESIKEDEK